MEFLLTETSMNYDDEGNPYSPHKDAVQKKYDWIEVRTCTEDYFDKKFGEREGLWRSKGVDHIKTDGGRYIQRRHPDDSTGWFIELETLEEMMDFVKENGRVVLSPGDEWPEIEIYNNYRE